MHTQAVVHVIYFDGAVSFDDGAGTVTLTTPGGNAGPLTPTFEPPHTSADLAVAIDAATVYGEYSAGSIRFKRPPLPNTGETTDQWLATVTLPQ